MLTSTWLHWSYLRPLAQLVLAAAAVGLHCPAFAADPESVVSRKGQPLSYSTDESGNRIPDFSYCGYAGGNASPPEAPVRVLVRRAGSGDDGAQIQAALDAVAKMPTDKNGLRGAVLLAPGTYRIGGQLRLTQSGVVLRGSGAGDGGTKILATGTDRRALISIAGRPERSVGPEIVAINADIVPVGATRLPLDQPGKLHVGDAVIVTRPSTAQWIEQLGANAFGVGWRPGSRDLRWDRTIKAVDGDSVTLDAPLTTAMESRYGGGTVQAYAWPG